MKKTNPADRVRERQEALRKMMEQQGEPEKKEPEEDKTTPGTGTLPQTGTPTSTDPQPSTYTTPSIDTVPTPNTVTDTDTVTGTSSLIKPTEIYIRKVGYFLEHQVKFIEKRAKKYKVKEAEIMRIAIEELIKSGKI